LQTFEVLGDINNTVAVPHKQAGCENAQIHAPTGQQADAAGDTQKLYYAHDRFSLTFDPIDLCAKLPRSFPLGNGQVRALP
jgi:hypothetical protein